jgi:hypothetical protein
MHCSKGRSHELTRQLNTAGSTQLVPSTRQPGRCISCQHTRSVTPPTRHRSSCYPPRTVVCPPQPFPATTRKAGARGRGASRPRVFDGDVAGLAVEPVQQEHASAAFPCLAVPGRLPFHRQLFSMKTIPALPHPSFLLFPTFLARRSPPHVTISFGRARHLDSA